MIFLTFWHLFLLKLIRYLEVKQLKRLKLNSVKSKSEVFIKVNGWEEELPNS